MTSVNHFIRAQEDGLGNRDAESFCRLEVDDQPELRRLFYWQVVHFGAFEQPIDVIRGPLEQLDFRRAIRHQAASDGLVQCLVHGRQLVRHSGCRNLGAQLNERWREEDENRPCAPLLRGTESAVEIVRRAQLDAYKLKAGRARSWLQLLELAPTAAVPEDRYARNARQRLLEQLEALAYQLGLS